MISILFALILIEACGASHAPKPDLPASVSPGWTRKSFDAALLPPGIPDSTKPDCWKATYASKGSADVWTCGYTVEGSAFDAAQRTRAEADTVKFQEGRYLVIVKWSGVSRDEITALVRAIQKALHSS